MAGPRLRLGIDVGGTNTDAVLMDGDQVVAWHKVATGEGITASIVAAAAAVLAEARAAPGEVFAVMLGTTQFTNAIVERRRLTEVAVLRLAAPATTAAAPATNFLAATSTMERTVPRSAPSRRGRSACRSAGFGALEGGGGWCNVSRTSRPLSYRMRSAEP